MHGHTLQLPGLCMGDAMLAAHLGLPWSFPGTGMPNITSLDRSSMPAQASSSSGGRCSRCR